MKISKAMAAFGAAAAVCAWGTDAAVADDADVAVELKYDNGTRSYFVSSMQGRDYWVGNDFDITMISDFRAITRIRVYSTPTWPNPKWDGFRVGVFAVAGGRPGSLIWGPEYVKPARAGYGWVNCPVRWSLPAANNAFVAAVELFYNYPNCDPYAVDANPTFIGHSWNYSRGSWSPLSGVVGYRNLMLRVVVNNDTVAVTPTSLGRVKALYH